MRALLLVALVWSLPSAAALYTCKEGDKTVFQSKPCVEETKDVVDLPRVRVKPVKQVASPPAASSTIGGACTKDDDCVKGRTCRKLDGKSTGSCY